MLATPASDEAHPAFSNLFVQTEFVPHVNGLLATRRPRSVHEEARWAAHVVPYDSRNEGGSGIEFETDRVKFLGRGRTVQAPLALMEGRRLSNTVGAVLDPIASLRILVTIAPGATVHASYATMVANSREAILNLADKYHDPGAFDRASSLAWTHAQVKLHYLRITAGEAQVFPDYDGQPDTVDRTWLHQSASPPPMPSRRGVAVEEFSSASAPSGSTAASPSSSGSSGP